MKRILFVSLISLLYLIQTKAERIAGYFITNSDDTIHVTLEIPINKSTADPDYYKIHWKIKYYDAKQKKSNGSS